jgi:plastocyanin
MSITGDARTAKSTPIRAAVLAGDMAPRSHSVLVLRAAAALLAAASACAAPAAGLTISVSDAEGKPLADAAALLEPIGSKPAVKPLADVQIAQAKRQFMPRLTIVTTGTPVTFPNFDTVRHHVYSFSAAKTFELKLYAGVPNAPVVFDKPGIAVLGCNIHDSMAAWVVVADTPWYARSAEDGRARIDNVPAGSYRLRVWHAGLGANVEPVTSSLTIGAADVLQAVRLPVSAQP